MEEAQAWADTTPYPVHYCLKCGPRSDPSNDTSDPSPTPQLVRDLEVGEVRQPHIKSRPIRLKVPETEHPTSQDNAPKLKLSKRIFVGVLFISVTVAVLVIQGIVGENGSGGETRGMNTTKATPVWGQVGENSNAGGTQERGSSWEKQLYYDMAVAEDRGDLEALKRSGGCAQDTSNMDVATYTSLSKQLMARYGDQVLAKHGVSRDQWSEIMWKGATERWETPDPPTC